MVLGDVRFTWEQRKRLHRFLVLLIAGNVTIGLMLLLIGSFSWIWYNVNFQSGRRSLARLVFQTVALYGFNILTHNLAGMKLCYNYFHYAEGSSTNLRLFVWTSTGLVMVLVGCFMACLCFSSSEHLVSEIRRSLLEGMKRYLVDVAWKRRIDNMQSRMQCCGIDSFNDWHQTYWLHRDLLVLDSANILEYAELDGRVTPPVVPWSCCRIDVKGPCYHDPLQLPNPERDSTYESLNTQGCLIGTRALANSILCSSIVLIALHFVLQVLAILASRLDFTAARNAVALGDRCSASPGWLYGRLDFGNAAGPNLWQIDRKYSGRGDPMIDLKPLVCASDTD